jgi:hypothetical protein
MQVNSAVRSAVVVSLMWLIVVRRKAVRERL